MKGYIKSKKTAWVHIFKMSVRPGGKVPLDELYTLYGKRHNISEKDFVKWLREVKLRGTADDWIIVEEEDIPVEPAVKEPSTVKYETNGAGDVVASKMSVQDVMNLPVRKAREIIPGIMDIKLLKFALRECKPLPNKESLCRIIDKRVMELSMHPNG